MTPLYRRGSLSREVSVQGRSLSRGGSLYKGVSVQGGSLSKGFSSVQGGLYTGVSVREIPHVDRLMPVKILPCPKLRLRVVIKQYLISMFRNNSRSVDISHSGGSGNVDFVLVSENTVHNEGRYRTRFHYWIQSVAEK